MLPLCALLVKNFTKTWAEKPFSDSSELAKYMLLRHLNN
jgi:hypothetical protein